MHAFSTTCRDGSFVNWLAERNPSRQSPVAEPPIWAPRLVNDAMLALGGERSLAWLGSLVRRRPRDPDQPLVA
jgi:hypothetical protein